MNTNFKFYLLTCAICILLFITILAPYIVPFDPYEQNLASTLQAPNTIHLLGTDKYGRDIFSRILIGSQTTIFSSLLGLADVEDDSEIKADICKVSVFHTDGLFKATCERT